MIYTINTSILCVSVNGTIWNSQNDRRLMMCYDVNIFNSPKRVEMQHISSANMSKSTFMMLYMIFCFCLVDKTTVNLKNFWRLYRHLSTLLIYNFLIWNFINSPVFLINIIFLKLLNMSSKKMLLITLIHSKELVLYQISPFNIFIVTISQTSSLML